jgi:hypothetical protein
LNDEGIGGCGKGDGVHNIGSENVAQNVKRIFLFPGGMKNV